MNRLRYSHKKLPIYGSAVDLQLAYVGTGLTTNSMINYEQRDLNGSWYASTRAGQ